MATRFYLPSTGASDVNPNFDASWTSSANADRRKCVTSKISSAMTDVTVNALSGASLETILVRQYVSVPIASQTISGSIKGQIRAIESVGSFNGALSIKIYVVSNDGSTVTGTLLALTNQNTTGSNEFALSLQNHTFMNGGTTPITLSNVTANAGDRIVIEIGINETGSVTTKTGTLNFGDNSGTDLPEDQTTATADNPWIEFSGTISFSTQYDKTHTTDALKRATTDKTHTTDALKKGTLSKTHTTDALLKGTIDKTHTTDTYLSRSYDKSHTTDALLKATQNKTHTTDSLLKGTIDKTHTTDTYLVSVFDKTHTTDTLLKATTDKTHTTDALLKGTINKTHTTDAFLSTFYDKTHTTDALLRATFNRTHTTDSLLLATKDKTHTTDAYLVSVVDKSHTTDSLLRATFIKTHTTDAYLARNETDGLKAYFNRERFGRMVMHSGPVGMKSR